MNQAISEPNSWNAIHKIINKSNCLDHFQKVVMFHLKILDSIAIIVLIVDVQDTVVVVIQVVHVVAESIFIKTSSSFIIHHSSFIIHHSKQLHHNLRKTRFACLLSHFKCLVKVEKDKNLLESVTVGVLGEIFAGEDKTWRRWLGYSRRGHQKFSTPHRFVQFFRSDYMVIL